MPFVLVPADLSLWDLIGNLRPVPLAIIILLLLFSLFSWTIVFSKGSVFSRARKDNHAINTFMVSIKDTGQLRSVMKTIEKIQGVHSVERIGA